MKIAVVGTGYVGLVTAVCLAEMGNIVSGVDIDREKIDLLNSGVSPIFEPGLKEMLSQNLAAAKISFTLKISEAIKNSETIFIALGTPQDLDGSADLKSVLQVADSIAQVMEGYKLIVIKSTVPPGTLKKVQQQISETLKRRGLNCDFDVASNPEFLREGSAIDDFLKPDRIILGLDSKRAQDTLQRLYEPLLKQGHGLIVMSPASSEMTKYAANSMLAAKISLMNELSRICENVGADIESVREGLGTDHRIGPHFLYAGIGYGGSCFSKDISALIKMGEEMNLPLELLIATQTVNKSQRVHFFDKIKNHYQGNLEGKTIAVWGVAFKPGTDDVRDAPAIDIVRFLLKAKAKVKIYDPAALNGAKKVLPESPDLHFVPDQYDVLKEADGLLVLTEWVNFFEPDFLKMKQLLKSPAVFDARNIYSPKTMTDLGFKYSSIGRP